MDFRGFFNKIKAQVGTQDGEAPPADGADAAVSSPEVESSLYRDRQSSMPRPESTPNPSTYYTPERPSGPVAGLQQRGAAPNARGIVQNEKDDSVYNMRSEHVSRIEAMFGEFGPTVCSYMLTHSLADGGVRRILIKLDLTSRGRDGADLAQVENWILRHGVEAFCEKVRIRNNKPGSPPPPPVMPPPVTDEAKISVRPLSAKDRPGLHAPSMPTPRPLAQPAAPRPRLAGQENASTQGFPGGASPHQKIGVVPLGLAGKDVQRVHNRPEQPQESGGQQPPAPPIATEDIVRAAIEESGKQLPVQP